jgi:uncharacterized protein
LRRFDRQERDKSALVSLQMESMACRPHCAACCIAPSISSAIPGMPQGKPAGIRCVQLGADELCLLFGLPERPAVCASLRPHPEMCGSSRKHAMDFLQSLERMTRPIHDKTKKQP